MLAFVLILSGMPDGLAGLARAQHTHPPLLQLGTSLNQWPTLLTGAIPYGVALAAIAGTNQQLVQRYMACKDLRTARRALWSAWAIGTAVAVLTLGLGVALLARYGTGLAEANDQILPTFIIAHVPVGLAGILLAAIFAAAMSSIDSSLNSSATLVREDIYRRYINPEPSERQSMRVLHGSTLLWGILGTAMALVLRG